MAQLQLSCREININTHEEKERQEAKERKEQRWKNTVLREATVKLEKTRLKAFVAAGGTEQRKCSEGVYKAGKKSMYTEAELTPETLSWGPSCGGGL